jgi:hypothetical protein
MTKRFAIYWAPRPGEKLAAFGAEWLGRDAETGIDMPQPPLPEIARLTAEPRRYGFHGTLKPPFALAQGCSEGELLEAVAALASDIDAFELPRLHLAAIGRFLALIPTVAPIPHSRERGNPPPSWIPAFAGVTDKGNDDPLNALAARCVMELDSFRRPATEAELERRRRGLTARQEALLQRWGYPYVLEEFRFHLTLTGPLAPEERAAIEPALAPLAAPHCEAPVPIRDLVVFVEPAPGAPLTVRGRFPLRRS